MLQCYNVFLYPYPYGTRPLAARKGQEMVEIAFYASLSDSRFCLRNHLCPTPYYVNNQLRCSTLLKWATVTVFWPLACTISSCKRRCNKSTGRRAGQPRLCRSLLAQETSQHRLVPSKHGRYLWRLLATFIASQVGVGVLLQEQSVPATTASQLCPQR